MKSRPDAPLSTMGGSMENRFQSGSEAADLGGGLRVAELSDRHTHRSFALWFLPRALAADPNASGILESRVAASIGISDGRILKTYGIHLANGSSAVRTEISRDPRLSEAGLVQEIRTAGLARVAGWLHQIAQDLDQADALHRLVHGAISPFWIRLTAAGTPRLEGISFAAAFADAGACRPEDVWFSSPARRRKDALDAADDVFGVAALAFWALAGGGRTEEFPGSEVQPGMIDRLRLSRGLPATGWRRGWDEAIVAGLAATPSLRPATATAVIAPLMTLVPEALRTSAAPALPAPLSRRAPPWRDSARGGRESNGAQPDQNGTDALTNRLGQVRRLEGEVAGARRSVENDLRDIARQRSRLQADLAAVARLAGEAESARKEFEARDQELIRKLRELQERESDLSDREAAAKSLEVAVDAKETAVVTRETAVATKQREVATLQDQLQAKAAGLDRSLQELALAREKLGVRQRELEGSDKELSIRGARLAAEMESLAQAREKIESETKALREEEEGFRHREAEVARNEATFEARAQAVATREQEIARGEAEVTAAREKVAAERADIHRLLQENKTIVDEAKHAESRVEAARAERARIEHDTGALRANLTATETVIKSREAAVKELDAALQAREDAAARREAMFRTLGIALQTGGGPAETEKAIAELTAKQRGLDDREWALATKETQLGQSKAELANASRENDRARTAIAEAQKQLERERSALTEKVQASLREKEAWDKERQEQRRGLDASLAEAEARKERLLLRAAVQNVMADTAAPTPAVAPPPHAEKRRTSPLWPVTAMAAVVAAAVLGFMYFRASDDYRGLLRVIDSASQQNALLVVTDPPGAIVSVAGRPPQPAPAKFENLPPGDITITAKKNGYRDEKRTVRLNAGETKVADPITLGPVPITAAGSGTLLVETIPSGAEVTVVGLNAPAQASPALFRNLPATSLTLEVRLADHIRDEVTAQIAPSGVTRIVHPLRQAPKVGKISVNVSETGAEVEVLGQKKRGNAEFDGLEPGEVDIAVTLKGFDPEKRRVRVTAGQTTRADFDLKPVKVVSNSIPPPVKEAKEVKQVPLLVVNLPAEPVIELRSAPSIRLVRIDPRGEVTINGAAKVQVTRPFFVGASEVTQKQFEAVMGNRIANPSKHKIEVIPGKTEDYYEDVQRTVPRGGATTVITERVPRKRTGETTTISLSDHPVESVTWTDAMEFCRALTDREKSWLPAGAVLRLPTESEWWSVAKANPAAQISSWFGQVRHRAVLRPTDDRSIADLFGNVGEWCLDAWNDTLPADATVDPLTIDGLLRPYLSETRVKYSIRTLAASGGARVVSGGGFRDSVGSNNRRAGSGPADDVGFRIVLGYPVGIPKSD